jgi:outer membrane protein assembly factor BamB
MLCRRQIDGWNCVVIHEDFIYGLDDGILCCLDLATGKRVWKKGRIGHGQMLQDQNALLISSDKGEIILISVDRQGYKELGRFQAVEGKTWNGPVLAGRRILLRSNEEMAAYDLSSHTEPLAND